MSPESYSNRSNSNRSNSKSNGRANSPGGSIDYRSAPSSASGYQSHSRYYAQPASPQARQPAVPQQHCAGVQPYPAPARRRPPQLAPVKPQRPPGLSPPSAAAAGRARSRRAAPPFVWAGGSAMLALMAFLLPHGFKAPAPSQPEVCAQVVQAQSFLSRDELSQLLAVPERASREAVRQVVAEPYCLLPSLTVREGETAEREAYPLEFDPQTWLVVLYEGGEYAGYDFSFR